jgi:hypothetical protein
MRVRSRASGFHVQTTWNGQTGHSGIARQRLKRGSLPWIRITTMDGHVFPAVPKIVVSQFEWCAIVELHCREFIVQFRVLASFLFGGSDSAVSDVDR